MGIFFIITVDVVIVVVVDEREKRKASKMCAMCSYPNVWFSGYVFVPVALKRVSMNDARYPCSSEASTASVGKDPSKNECQEG